MAAPASPGHVPARGPLPRGGPHHVLTPPACDCVRARARAHRPGIAGVASPAGRTRHRRHGRRTRLRADRAPSRLARPEPASPEGRLQPECACLRGGRGRPTVERVVHHRRLRPLRRPGHTRHRPRHDRSHLGAVTSVLERSSARKRSLPPGPDGSGLVFERDDLGSALPAYPGESTTRYQTPARRGSVRSSSQRPPLEPICSPTGTCRASGPAPTHSPTRASRRAASGWPSWWPRPSSARPTAAPRCPSPPASPSPTACPWTGGWSTSTAPLPASSPRWPSTTHPWPGPRRQQPVRPRRRRQLSGR